MCVCVQGVCVTLTRKLTSSNFKLNTCGSYPDDRALQALSYLLRRDEEREGGGGGGGEQERESKERRGRQRTVWTERVRERDTHTHTLVKERGGGRQREGSQAESESCCFCISVFFMSRQFTGRLFTVWYLALLGHCSQYRLPLPSSTATLRLFCLFVSRFGFFSFFHSIFSVPTVDFERFYSMRSAFS